MVARGVRKSPVYAIFKEGESGRDVLRGNMVPVVLSLLRGGATGGKHKVVDLIIKVAHMANS